MLDAKRVEITRHVIVGIHIEFLFWLLNSRAEQAELRRQIHPLKPSALVHSTPSDFRLFFMVFTGRS